MKIALILAISAICFAGEALPASTANAVKAYDAEMAKAKAEYDKRDEAAKKVLVVALKKSQDAETKAGNLEGALAIKKRIEELTPNLLGGVEIISAIYDVPNGKNGIDAIKYILEKTENGTKPYIDKDEAWKVIGHPSISTPTVPKFFFVKYKINNRVVEKKFGQDDIIEFK